ncbi:putative secreted protein [Wickerhamomyces ciferrii]|uniref:Secreted protein n=1 Tax=Wickerhamomyces ciferrii (strain ATCC 14091 / BCRC 22168 / CBS 111 / JCM 3599 / NBRC 0793 / NRRL Y-1031 F-60-10) TaxID=1206466 RepID=K0KK07_WICCF|nr:uncharacterized protein BN7_1004 [Wickerhamomyces ciferrii]CCH41463.1 putative secreted protein [Wickerhamomyces ciferrii]
MKYYNLLALGALPSLITAAALPDPQITKAPLAKRAQLVLTDSIWTSTSSGIIMAITPTVIDAVTISASPVTDKPTPWASLDGSGIPSLVTPTVSDGKTISASPTPSNTDYPSPAAVPPVLRCFGDRVPEDGNDKYGYPFCTALNGTEMIVGETYWITWDPTYWGGDDITRVKLELKAYPQTGAGDTLFETPYLSNSDAYYPLTITSSMIKNEGYFWLIISPLTTSTTKATNVGEKSGPLLRAINSKSDAITTINRVPSDNGHTSTKSSGSGSNAKTIAPAVVIPVIAVIGIAIFVVWFLNKQKKSVSQVLGFSKASRSNNSATGDRSGDIQLSPSTTNGDTHTIASAATDDTSKNPFAENSRTVL